ncbi:MAG: HAMP domain-containing sensor histidine kinase [Thermodesulfovibrionales bacterium]|jgi:two-component system sensor histidine kinase BaeS
MRTKLFLGFLLVIFIALISNLIFERLTMNDFDEYIKGTKEDHLYWVLASVEGSYEDGRWDMNSLSESVHWGTMLGFEIRIEDREGRKLIDSRSLMDSLPPSMKHRMESVVPLHKSEGEFEKYPLYIEGRELGTLFVRPLHKVGSVQAKENIFKKRGRNFLIISFFIAGAGALAIAVFLSLSLSRPMKRLQSAAERVAKGDFRVRVEPITPTGRRFRSDEIGRLSESFNYMAEALEKEESLRKRLTSNIAHELRTPLAVMKAQIEALIDGLIENTAEGLENIRSEIEKLTRLVQGIENMTKAEASFFSRGEYRKIDLKDFLKDIESSMELVFRDKRLQFSVIDRGGLEATTDPDKLEMILKNIISNALKYTERGGVWIDYGRDGKEFFIEVRDTGMGIPEDEIPKIFMRFYRGRGTSDNGIGVGLAIVKELVTVMAGRIDVQSQAGKGTAFRIWLPLYKDGQGFGSWAK